MNARQRAARVAAEIQHSRASADMARGVKLGELGVQVRGNEVRKIGLTWNSSRYLGSLVGACAGVMDVKRPGPGAMLSSIVIGNVPRVGTIFIAFANGTRHEVPLLQGSLAQMQKVDAAVARFNAMVDVADRNTKEIIDTEQEQLPSPITVPQDVIDLVRQGRKINAIKRYRELNKIGLKEAKDIIDRI